MTEVKEYLEKEGHSPEPNQLDPRVAEAGVVDVDHEDHAHLSRINDHLQAENIQAQIGGPEQQPVHTEPHPDSVARVNGHTPAQNSLPENPQGGVGFMVMLKSAWESVRNGNINPWKGTSSIVHTDTVADIIAQNPSAFKSPETVILNSDPVSEGTNTPESDVNIPEPKEELPHAA